MTPDTVVRLLAAPGRMRVLAAVALGTDTPDKAAESAGLPRDEVTAALGRLLAGGLVVATDDRLTVGYGHLRALCRDTGDAASGTDESVDQTVRPFIRDGRLLRLPAQQSRRRAVLKHVAETSFEPGVEYDERAVNDKLRIWCEGSETDHVSVRRYLVDAGILTRANGVYSRDPRSVPRPGAAERYVRAMGLD